MRNKNTRFKIFSLTCVCICALLAGILSVIAPIHSGVVKAEESVISPTEVKANATFDDEGIYTSNYEINFTFSSAFATCGDGNAAPTLYADLADKLMIGDKSVSEWWTTFSSSQNNFTVQKWGNRLRVIFNESLMHNTLQSTALDGMFVIQLAESVTNDLGTFRSFKYEMTPTKGEGGWSVVAKSVYTDFELANANRITANLTALDLKLCASAADHNLWFTFDQKAFAYDGVVASSGQIGVLANIKLNGKTLHEWYNYNTAGTLDTILFYPQEECHAVVMQFKIDRMTTLFENDPISQEDLVIESEELVWEYYEGETLTIVTIPAFSYTYSQKLGQFFKTEELPDPENANRITANLTALDLQLYASEADHNLRFTFDQEVFKHDGVVASSGQIGVLANIKLNGKTLHEWYNYNTAGTLDTVAFYPQEECHAVVMQFKIERMATLFEEDPIYHEDLVIESEELVWEYFEDGELTIVTIPAFSYTYSQKYEQFFKTEEVPDPEKANRITANLTALDLKLCASAADHNLLFTFDQEVFKHDGVVASSGQIGVLANIKLNGKTLHEWYNYNTAGTLDTVAFYPQQECHAVVMQFKMDRMATLFEKDPIYHENLVIEAEDLVWEWYEEGELTIVTIPAFSYTYSQAHGQFFKTGEVPETTSESLKVKDVSPISTFKEDSGHTPGTQVFSIAFWKDVCGPTSIMYMPSYEEILDNVLLNGKTLRDIQESAVNKNGDAFPSGITVQMCGYMGATDKRLVIYLNGDLADEFLFKKAEGETVTIKAGFTSKLGAVVAEDVVFEYYQGAWRKVLDTSSLEYTDLQVTSISRLQFIGETINGKRAATFFIYFDRAVSLERLLYVGRNKENLIALKDQGALKISEEKIYGIVDNHIGDYVLDYIKYDGKTLRETLQAEDTLAMQTWGIDIHYTGDTFDTKAIQITFNAEAKCLISDGNTHTIEIMEGFVSPLLGKTKKSYKFELLTDTNGWKNISVGVEGDYPELPKSEYVEPDESSSGCGSTIEMVPITTLLLASVAVVLNRKRREQDEN